MRVFALFDMSKVHMNGNICTMSKHRTPLNIDLVLADLCECRMMDTGHQKYLSSMGKPVEKLRSEHQGHHA